jgi:hypothetical protein
MAIYIYFTFYMNGWWITYLPRKSWNTGGSVWGTAGMRSSTGVPWDKDSNNTPWNIYKKYSNSETVCLKIYENVSIITLEKNVLRFWLFVWLGFTSHPHSMVIWWRSSFTGGARSLKSLKRAALQRLHYIHINIVQGLTAKLQ